MAITVFATRQQLRQAEPPKSEGRAQFVVGQGPGGGDGLTFATGSEVFQWSSNQTPGAQQPSGILGAWVDATGLSTGKTLQIKTPNQTFQFAAGAQGYIPITAQMPFTATISSPNGGTGTVTVIFYNYNPLFTGSVATAPAAGSETGSGGGSPGYSGGGYQPGRGGENQPEL